MDMKTLLKTLDVSWFKVLVLRIFDKGALVDYILEKANDAVNALMGANEDTFMKIRSALVTALGFYRKYEDLVPLPWKPYADAYVAVLDSIVVTTADGKIDGKEFAEIADNALKAYAMYAAE